ncbi:MAG TPA: Gfo/Idh/MocA family oxidoreductase [Polyangiaceae bacterium]|nr:Gfo/Idh/MocA family oxidoreductase [Polyangiaceae bacterium]
MSRPQRPSTLDRRRFLGTAAAVAAPLFVPSRVFGATAPSNRLRVAQVGCGRIAQVHDMPGVLDTKLADYVAVCDLDTKRTGDARGWLEKYYQTKQLGAAPPVTAYQNYRELFARKDIDAVVISVPDHWHAELILAAVRSNKDVYVQKPFTLTHAEGVLVRDAVVKSGRIVQIGSQQRSSQQWRRAAELVRAGRIGAVRRVEIGLPVDPTQPDPPSQAVPTNLDFDAWLGCTPKADYTEARVHPQADYSRPGWLRNDAYCLGMITGWGSHHFDSMHWALDCENGGPSKVEGRAEFPKNSVWNVHGPYDITLTYPGGISVSVSNRHPNGLKFYGDNAWLWVTRDGTTTSSDPKNPGPKLPPLDASDPRLLDPNGVKVQLPQSTSHHLNWVEAVRSRKPPIAPATVAHRSNSACIVSWIAMKLGRPLEWDAKAERFKNDPEANAMLSRSERAPYGVSHWKKG